MLQQRRLECDVRRDAADHERVQRLAHAGDRLVACRAVADQLGDHRVVVHRHFAALVDAGIDAHLSRNLRRRDELDEPPAGRQEAAQRILGVDAALDRPAGALDVLLRELQPLAGGDADHQLDEVEPGDELGHRVLDLQPRVHLQEVERPVLADDELDRPGGLVLDRAGELHRLLAHRLARRFVDERRGRLFDDFLVATLDRAFALAQIDEVAVRVAEHLDLDVARLLDELLDEDAIVAEGVLRPRCGSGRSPRGTACRRRRRAMPLPPPPAEALIMTG